MAELKKAARPVVLDGKTYFQYTGCGKVYVTINRHKGHIFELFIRAAKAGGCMAAQCETIGRLVSWQARHGLDVKGLIPYIKGISCKERLGKEGEQSCADAIALVLELDIEREKQKECSFCERLIDEKNTVNLDGDDFCTDCAGKLKEVEDPTELHAVSNPDLKTGSATDWCVSDDKYYPTDPPQLKCRNCGQFYILKDGPPKCTGSPDSKEAADAELAEG